MIRWLSTHLLLLIGLLLLPSHLAFSATVIDRIEYGGSERLYNAGPFSAAPFLLVDWSSNLVLSDGQEIGSAAGISSGLEVLLAGKSVSGSTITYYFTRKPTLDLPLDDNHFNYIQKSVGAGSVVYFVELNYDGPLAFTAELGGKTASLSGYAIVASYEHVSWGIPSAVPGAAPIGSLVPFEMHYELMGNSVWTETLFEQGFEFHSDGWVDFTKSVPEPSSALFSLCGLGALLIRRQRS